MKSRVEEIARNLKEIKSKLNDRVTLVAVSKTFLVEDILIAYRQGQRDFGENRIQDFIKKAQDSGLNQLHDLCWHFIGKIQSNKVKMLLQAPNLKYLHAIDSLKLLKELYKYQDLITADSLKIFLQVNTSNETEKAGFLSYQDVKEVISFIKQQSDSKIKLWGLMTMGPIRTDDFELDARKSFLKLSQFKEKLLSEGLVSNLKLSMGMSDDFLIAQQIGTDYVRIGSAIFGERS